MADVEDRLSPRGESESVDDYVRRGFNEAAGGRREVAQMESADRRYTSDNSYKGTKYSADSSLAGTKIASANSLKGTMYSADRGLEGTKYSSDRGLEGTKYSSDKSLEGTKYRADVDERGNRLQAGNQFLTSYAQLSSQPRNYFQAQEFLNNGLGAGYGSLADEAVATGRPASGFHPYVSASPGNAAQALFHQGGGEEQYTTYAVPADGVRRDPATGAYWTDVMDSNTGQAYTVQVERPARQMYAQGGDPTGNDFDEGPIEEMTPVRRPEMDDVPGTHWIWQKEPTTGKYSPMRIENETGEQVFNSPPGPRPYAVGERYWAVETEPTTGQRMPILFDAVTGRQIINGAPAPEDGYEQGGGKKFKSYLGEANQRFSMYGVNNIADQALADWRRESGRQQPNLKDPVDRSNFDRYMEDWRGVKGIGNPAPRVLPEPVFRPQPEATYVAPSPEPVFRPQPEAQYVAPQHPAIPEHLFNIDPDQPEAYAQGGADWASMDTWASGEDKARLDQMDAAFRPGVHKWKAGYWEGLSDDDKDLWRSYWGYRGLAPRSVEAQIASTRTGNGDYFGQGRVA